MAGLGRREVRSRWRVAGKIEVPVERVTSCCFGGDNWDELYITTASRDLDEAGRAEQPQAGGVFHCKPGVSGPSTNVFGLVRDALRDDQPVDFLGVIVGFVEVLDFVVTHKTAFLIPAFFHPGKTPLGAALGSPDRFAIPQKPGSCVRRENSGQSTAVLNRHLKRDVA